MTYGDLVMIPAMFGREEMLLSYDPSTIEKVFRTEGEWPVRIKLEMFEYYRKQYRPEVFKNYGSLANDNGEEWFKFRSKANPVLLPPKTVKMYIGKIDDVAKDLIDQIREIRNPETLEAPDTFGRISRCVCFG